MKTSIKHLDYERVLALKKPTHKKPLRPMWLLSGLIWILSLFEALSTKFSYTTEGMEKLKKKEPFLILMNHSSFLDLKIASRIFFPMRYTIVTSWDAFVGKRLLMRLIGCISTRKFVTDLTLLKDIRYSLQTLKCPVLMFPEAGYSFDGRATVLPDTLGSFVKMMKVPVVTVITSGVFNHEPLYGGLRMRKIKTSAHVKYLLSPEEIAKKSADEIGALLKEAFTFDGFAWQKENQMAMKETFLAEGLNRILYRCCECGAQGGMEGKGNRLTCHKCGREWDVTPLNELRAVTGQTRFSHIPDWVDWERSEIVREIKDGSYRLDCDCDIAMMVDYKSIYMVGSGHLTHDETGFTLTGCDGRLNYSQKPQASYEINADYYWYEIGDVISIGNSETLYFCFPKNAGDVVYRTRMAVEELYQMTRKERRSGKA